MTDLDPSKDSDGAPAMDPEQFLRDFQRRMAEQGLMVRMAKPQPNWKPAITLDVSGDEASAMVVRLRRGEVCWGEA